MAGARDVVLRYIAESDISGLNAATEATDRLRFATEKSSGADRQATDRSVELELSKRRLMGSTQAVTSSILAFNSTSGRMTDIMQAGGSALGLFGHALGGFLGPVSVGILLVSAIAEGVLKFGENAEKAQEKLDASKLALEFYSNAVEKLRANLDRTDAQMVRLLEHARFRERELKDTKDQEEAQRRIEPLLEEEAKRKEQVKGRTEELAAAEARLAADRQSYYVFFRGNQQQIEAALARQVARIADLKTEIGTLRSKQAEAHRDEQRDAALAAALDEARLARAKRHAELLAMMAEARTKAEEKRLAFMERERIADQNALDLGQRQLFQAESALRLETIGLGSEFDKRRRTVDDFYSHEFQLLTLAKSNGENVEAALTRLKAFHAAARLKIDEDATKVQMRMNATALQSYGALLGSVADLVEATGGKELEAVKAIRVAETVANSAAAAMAAYATSGPIGAAAAVAAGIAAIAKIESASIGGGGGGVSIPSPSIGIGEPGGAAGVALPAVVPAGLGAPAQAAGPASMTVNFGGVTFQGLDPDSVTTAALRRFVRRLMDEIAYFENGAGARIRYA